MRINFYNSDLPIGVEVAIIVWSTGAGVRKLGIPEQTKDS